MAIAEKGGRIYDAHGEQTIDDRPMKVSPSVPLTPLPGALLRTYSH